MPKGQYPRKKAEETIASDEVVVAKEEIKEEVVVEKPVVLEIKPEPIPEPPKAVEPVQPSIEVTIEGGVVNTKVYPQIRVGVCEFHGTPYGVVDAMTLKGKCHHHCATDPLCPHSKTGCPKGKPIYEVRDGQEVLVGYEEYCRHEHDYRGLPIRCTYCPKDVNMRDVIKNRTLYVYGSPDNPNKLIVCCSDYRCVKKHFDRFNKSVV